MRLERVKGLPHVASIYRLAAKLAFKQTEDGGEAEMLRETSRW